jgi:hypothetical protein
MTLENRAKVNDELYKAADPASFATRVIPTPLKVTPGQGAVDVSAGLAVDMAALPADMQAAAKALMASQKVAAVRYGGACCGQKHRKCVIACVPYW